MEQRSRGRPGRGTIWLTTLILLGLAVVFGVVGWHAGRPGTATTFVSTARAGRTGGTQESPPANAPRLLDRRDAASGGLASEPLLRPGDDRDYATLAARLGSLAGKDNVAATLLMRDASAACRHPPEPGWRVRVVKPRAVAYTTWREGFCNRSVSAAEQDAIGERGKAAFDRRHPEWPSTGPGSSTQVLDAVLSSDDVEVMDMAYSFVRWGGANAWDVGGDLVQGSPYEANLRKYQGVALQDMACAETGGCGPGGLRSATVCLMSDGYDCAPGQGAYDVWNDRFSPEEVDIILGIEQRILDERVRRAAAPPN